MRPRAASRSRWLKSFQGTRIDWSEQPLIPFARPSATHDPPTPLLNDRQREFYRLVPNGDRAVSQATPDRNLELGSSEWP
jgi:hypothetical protein